MDFNKQNYEFITKIRQENTNALVLKNERIALRSFEKLFDLKKLANTKNDYDKTGINPCGDADITKLIIKVLKA